ncbi:helix-turn-helix transcriptional regulator [Treponema sp.]|nr:helix-turn-helix transcriptional regulator [Treponema sp.]MBR4322393.1 helix-turn-helix transcriptional regulator [Treponema sp.]
MTENQLREILSQNIKKYRKGKFTQEQLAEEIGVSTQNINDIEGKRRWPRESTLIKIAEILKVEVYQLFIPQNSVEIKIEETDENMQIQRQIQNKLVSDFRKAMNKMLDKWNQID